jgi:tetratricopeptide (TPR) repeat protein
VLEPSIYRAGVNIEPCDIPIHHYGRLNDEKARVKMENYYRLGKIKLSITGDDPNAIRELAIQAAELGNHEEALELWARYIAFMPKHHVAYFNMSTSYLETGQFEKALDAARVALKLIPDAKESILCYAAASLCCGDVDDAVLSLENLLHRIPGYPPARTSLAAAYSLKGREDKSLALLQEMRRMNYDCSVALYSLSQKLVAAGRTHYAVPLLETMESSGHIHPHGKEFLESLRSSDIKVTV